MLVHFKLWLYNERCMLIVSGFAAIGIDSYLYKNNGSHKGETS